MSSIAAMVTCFVLMWSRGSADDVIVSTTWLYKRLSSVVVLEATYDTAAHRTNTEHIPGQCSDDDRSDHCGQPWSAAPVVVHLIDLCLF